MYSEVRTFCIVFITFCSIQIGDLLFEVGEEIFYRNVSMDLPEAKKQKLLLEVPPMYRDSVQTLCAKYRVPLAVAVPLIQTESEWNQDVVGYNTDGSFDVGLCQLNSQNHDRLKLLFPDYSVYNGQNNLEMGIWFLSDLYRSFKDWFRTVAAYNSGPNSVWRNKVPKVTKKYAEKILSYQFKL